MKTPRELLLHRHREVEPALDEVRAEVLRTLVQRNAREVRPAAPTEASFLSLLWQELFVSCRRYWMGLATAWCAIVVIAVVGRMGDADHPMVATGPTEPIVRAIREQQRLRAELLGTAVFQEVHAPRAEPAPKPRSEVPVRWVSV